MINKLIHFIRLPLLLILIFAIARFSLGIAGVPYAPRGNAMFSIAAVSLISSFYFGALAGRVPELGWKGVILIGIIIGLFSQILIFTATLISYLANLNTYFIHWDALNVPEGTTMPMAQALRSRLGGLVFGPITMALVALIGRLFSFLAPKLSPVSQD
jgi:hypothetical protein